jgi:Fic family protein
MDPKKFVDSEFGEVGKEPGNKWAFWFYSPASIPRVLELAPRTVLALSAADAALGHLQGISALISDPELLIGPYLTREAVASSRIEGTQASLSDVMQAEAGEDAPSQSEDVTEVTRYLQASRQAFSLIEDLPISQRLILEIHRTLLSGVRGEEKNPGEFRKTPVWVGRPGATPVTADFVPPLPDAIPELITDWERYVNNGSGTPVLVQCALMHYQFETIHPFLDGNGRIGRLMINLLLKEKKRLEFPVLYLSGYLESHRDEYYSRLQAVREKGEIQEWLQFFLSAIKNQADDAVWRARQLVQLREEYLRESYKTRSKLPQLIELLFRNPYVTVRNVERVTTLTNQGARNLIRKAEDRGWVRSIGTHGRGGREYWLASEIFRVIDAPMRYEDD